jgi:outer membrane protein assembly factor BamB
VYIGTFPVRARELATENNTNIGDRKKFQKITKPYLLPGVLNYDPSSILGLKRIENPFAHNTIGDLEGMAVNVKGPDQFPLTILVQPYEFTHIIGLDAKTIRYFRYDKKSGSIEPVWNSGINKDLGFIWTKIKKPGIYVPIGLPRDRLLQELLQNAARQHRFSDIKSSQENEEITTSALKLFIESPLKELEQLRQFLTKVEMHTSLEQVSMNEVKVGQGMHFLSFHLPKGLNLQEFRKDVLTRLKTPHGGLPEENLFYPPEMARDGQPLWPLPQGEQPWNGVDWRQLQKLAIWKYADIGGSLGWLLSKNWWMYQHDQRHTGHASGLSDIMSANNLQANLFLQSVVTLDGPIFTKPSIVNGKVYVGSSKNRGGPGGTLHKISLATGIIDGRFPTSGNAYYGIEGIGGSPAIVGGKVYFTAVHGKVYCIDAAGMTSTVPYTTPLWMSDLKNADPSHKQPVNNIWADAWSGPLVVNGKVYVGCGEGEQEDTYGFVYCLDANTGNVIWLYCTCKFTNRYSPGSENLSNVIPASVAISDPLPQWAVDAGFSIYDDSDVDNRETGCSVWSSCAYDKILNRIYVGTGNSQYKDDDFVASTDLPEEWYGSGLISLDANTGQFRGYFQPNVEDSYWPHDWDIDVPGAPSIIWIGGRRVVAFGSKNGSFFLLDPDTLTPVARRQLLPRQDGTGLPGDRGNPISTVVPETAENKWGVMGTPAVDPFTERIFVGVGGYEGIGDQNKTPFLRALDSTLRDSWPVVRGPDGVDRYTTSNPPLYRTNEAGLSSPAVVNDVVFVSTSKPALYALDINTGLCLWSAPGLPPSATYCLGPAIYGNYVVVGAGDSVYIYRMYPWRIIIPEDIFRPEFKLPWPEPDPPPIIPDRIDQVSDHHDQ